MTVELFMSTSFFCLTPILLPFLSSPSLLLTELLLSAPHPEMHSPSLKEISLHPLLSPHSLTLIINNFFHFFSQLIDQTRHLQSLQHTPLPRSGTKNSFGGAEAFTNRPRKSNLIDLFPLLDPCTLPNTLLTFLDFTHQTSKISAKQNKS
jgi:hypothetical protein